MDKTLADLIEWAKAKEMTPEERLEQAASWVYGQMQLDVHENRVIPCDVDKEHIRWWIIVSSSNQA